MADLLKHYLKYSYSKPNTLQKQCPVAYDRVIAASALAFALWEHAITFGDEVKLVWR